VADIHCVTIAKTAELLAESQGDPVYTGFLNSYGAAAAWSADKRGELDVRLSGAAMA
jgi:hypothetical protein